MKKFKPKEIVTKSVYKRLSIICICGEELDVDYDGKLTNRTWCVYCHRYYEKENDVYVLTKYRCLECQTQHKKLVLGFDRHGREAYVCNNCLEKRINTQTQELKTIQKELKTMNKKEVYNPDNIE